jgi:hypothetical protein
MLILSLDSWFVPQVNNLLESVISNFTEYKYYLSPAIYTIVSVLEYIVNIR